MTKKQRVGIVILVAGSLIVLCAGLVWLMAPLATPPPSSTTATYEPSSSPFSAPALSPYIPPTPSTGGDEAVDETSTIVAAPSETPPGDQDSFSSSSEWNVISYAETKLIGAHDRAMAKPSLRMSIPALGIDAPVVPVSLEEKQSDSNRPYRQWFVPDSYAVGWHDSSAPPGQTGNTVLNGHNNIHGAVFGNLVDLTLGEKIILYKADQNYIYQVVHREFLPEQGESLRTRLRNARWIAPSDDMRLTVVTCWPNSSNSHRLVVVAQAVPPEPG